PLSNCLPHNITDLGTKRLGILSRGQIGAEICVRSDRDVPLGARERGASTRRRGRGTGVPAGILPPAHDRRGGGGGLRGAQTATGPRPARGGHRR
ncbi:unnamed protein product, partial [Ectocarpus sp. 12 AP-2014]